MRCRQARDWLSLARDGQLPPDKTLSLERHIEACGDCRTYRADLKVGQRLIKAVRPMPSEGFEWRLQLKLNQMLQEAAQAASLPWGAPERNGGRWLRAFGFSTLGAVAAVVALGLLLPPTPMHNLSEPGRLAMPAAGSLQAGPVTPASTVSEATPWSISGGAGANDRLPFLSRGFAPGGQLQTVSTDPLRGMYERSRASDGGGLFAGGVADPQTLARLQDENRRLHLALLLTQRELQVLKSQIDTSGANLYYQKAPR